MNNLLKDWISPETKTPLVEGSLLNIAINTPHITLDEILELDSNTLPGTKGKREQIENWVANKSITIE